MHLKLPRVLQLKVTPLIRKLADGITPDPKAGTDWCFVYGEREWIDGKKFKNIKLEVIGNAALEITPKGRVNCTTGAPVL